MGGYAFGHEWELERERLALLEHIFDPGTIRHLTGAGVAPGWRCLEVGAGAGSIARWLCERAGPDGRVLATDVETDFLEQLDVDGLEVRRHDIVAEELEEGAFDLIHARLVLEHLPERDLALKRLAGALAPGGVMVIEDFDWSALVPAPCAEEELFERGHDAVLDLMQTKGYTPWYGRQLPGELRNRGLDDLGAEGWIGVGIGGTPAARWWRLTIARLSGDLVGRRQLSEGDLERWLDLHDDPSFCFHYPALITAWGRRPAD
ncbi:MAG TPA: methyltransferase [Acidimicrobiia bacterium]|nr:methyltransferase [Acidimicrobiia bacterium]